MHFRHWLLASMVAGAPAAMACGSGDDAAAGGSAGGAGAGTGGGAGLDGGGLGAPPTPTGTGTYGRLRYISKYNVLILVNSPGEVFFYKNTAGGEA